MATRKQLTSTVRDLFGNDLTAELRQLIDLAVRRQLTTQDVVERLVNTRYFRRSFPGLVERNGTIANQLSGRQGVSVSVSSLAGAIKNYGASLEQFGNEARKYGYKFNNDKLAVALKAETSLDEFKARLAAVETVDSNPALRAAYEQQQRLAGIKPTPNSAYRAAVGAGDKKFMNLYEAAKYQTDLDLSRRDAAKLAGGRAIPAAAGFEDVNQIVEYARQNLQQLQPELAAQGITAARLVKVLGNPGAYAAEIEKIKTLATQRQSLFGRGPVGTYAQQGAGGGLATYPEQRDQSY